MIVDRQGRSFRNLRVSITAACNYACQYCVPNGQRLLKAKYELNADELLQAVKYLVAAAGIEKLRITGGDPLVSPKFDEFLPKVMELGLKDVSFTTNGQLLMRKMGVIADSGITRVNVSLDSLDANKYQKIARGGDLPTVIAGIEGLLDKGIKVKLNMVPMADQNVDQVLPILEFALDRGIELRYIELMRMGHLSHSASYNRSFVSMATLLETVASRYEYRRTQAPFDSTSVRYEIPGRGTFGIIANSTEPFCSSCTRLRLSADGKLYGCLSNSRCHDISDLLPLPQHQALSRLQTILYQALSDKQESDFSGEETVMKFIGG